MDSELSRQKLAALESVKDVVKDLRKLDAAAAAKLARSAKKKRAKLRQKIVNGESKAVSGSVKTEEDVELPHGAATSPTKDESEIAEIPSVAEAEDETEAAQLAYDQQLEEVRSEINKMWGVSVEKKGLPVKSSSDSRMDSESGSESSSDEEEDESEKERKQMVEDFEGIIGRFQKRELTSIKKGAQADEELDADQKVAKHLAETIEPDSEELTRRLEYDLLAGKASNFESQEAKISRKRLRATIRPQVSVLKLTCDRPDTVELWDTTAPDPYFLVFTKSLRNSVKVPVHWNQKRKYLSGKKGIEKLPFKLPPYIEATKIGEIRAAILEKDAQKSLKQKQREKVRPKSHRMHVDFQTLHDAFFKYATKPALTGFGDIYYEGKEKTERTKTFKPGNLSVKMREALGMTSITTPPPWLINMQRYGPPPSYPNIKVPGLNSPLPVGAEWGFHANGWGQPPVDAYGNALYPGVFAEPVAHQVEKAEKLDMKSLLWGEVVEVNMEESEEELSDEETSPQEQADAALQAETESAAKRAAESSAHLSGISSVIPGLQSVIPGIMSTTGTVSSFSGLETPLSPSELTRGIGSVVSGQVLSTPSMPLYSRLEQTTVAPGRSLFPSTMGYKIPAATGAYTPTPTGAASVSGIGRTKTRDVFPKEAVRQQLREQGEAAKRATAAAGHVEAPKTEISKKAAKKKLFKF